MAAITFSNASTLLGAALANSSNSTLLTQLLNAAQRAVAREHRWPELMSLQRILTTAPYTTGTVAVTADGTTWTLTGGTYPTDVATGLYWIGLSYSDPRYRIITRTSGTAVETTGFAYQEATQTASAYVVYKNFFSLASTAERVEEAWLQRAGGPVELTRANTVFELYDGGAQPSGAGVPTMYYNQERDSSGNVQIALGPVTPDDTYAIDLIVRRRVTDDTFTGNLDDSRWPLILSYAKWLGYQDEFPERVDAEWARYQRLLHAEWSRTDESETQSVRVGQDRVAFPGRWYTDLLSHGRVTGLTT